MISSKTNNKPWEVIMGKKILFNFYLIFLFISCRGPNEPVPLRSPELWDPIVTGIFITHEDTPETSAIWGNPSISKAESQSDCPIRLDNPYPNPTNGSTGIAFEVLKRTEVRIWIAPATLYTLTSHNAIIYSNGIYGVPGGLCLNLLWEVTTQGRYHVTWAPYTQNAEQLPSGFYRVYLESDEFLIWRDILLAWDIADIPIDMKEYIQF